MNDPAAPRSKPLLIACQLALGVGAIAATGLSAVRGDAALLVPLTPGAAATLPARAMTRGTRLIGAGALPGSLIVRRDDRNDPVRLGRDILSIPYSPRLCGAG